MADIAHLGIKIDSDGVVTANQRVKQLGDTGNTTEQSTQKLESSWSKFSKTIITLNQGLQLAKQIFGTVKRAVDDLVSAYGEQENAMAILNAALISTGHIADVNQHALYRLASSLQNVTTYGDEVIISAMALLQQLGNLNEQGLKKVTPALLDFATAQKVDLQAAASLVGKTLGSTTNALSRYGIELDATADPAEKLTMIVQALNEKFGGTAEAVGATTLGALKQYSNALGDLKEQGGKFLAWVLEPASRQATEIFTTINDSISAAQALRDALAGRTTDYESAIIKQEQNVAKAEKEALAWMNQYKLEMEKGSKSGVEWASRTADQLLNQLAYEKGVLTWLQGLLEDQNKAQGENADSADDNIRILKELEDAYKGTTLGTIEATEARIAFYKSLDLVAHDAQRDEVVKELERELEILVAKYEIGDATMAEFYNTGTDLTGLLPQVTNQFAIQGFAAEQAAAMIAGLNGDMNAYYNTLPGIVDETNKWADALDDVGDNIARIESGEMKQYLADLEDYNERLDQIGENLLWSVVDQGIASFRELGEAMTSSGENMKTLGDVVINFTTALMDMTAGVLVSIAKAMVEQNINNWPAALGLLLGAAAISTYSGAASSFTQNAQGNAYDGGNVIPFRRGGAFSNMIVDQPTLFPMAHGAGLMGEAGPEAIMPLARTPSGDLGVKAAGTQINVRVENYTNAQVSTERRRTPTGEELVFIINAAMRDAINKGDLDGAMRQNYGVARKGIA